MRTDIELLELLRQHAIDCHTHYPCYILDHAFEDPLLCEISEQISGGGLCFVAAALHDTEKINKGELNTLRQLINYNKPLAMHIDEYTGEDSAWYFPYGELEPRLQYIDLIIEKIKTNETK